jgi:precorrin-2/cobalt-factor-2 C20-methyltransferase
VHKSSVYLPPELKERLASVAARSGRSEADLIRTAIDHLVGVADAPRHDEAATHLDAPRPCLFGVGMGPGDPDLVTLRARRVIAGADRVLVLTTDARSVGRAEMTVRATAAQARLARVPFAIGADETARRHSLAAAVDAVLAGTDAGEVVALALLGDPSQWTVFGAVADELRRQRPDLHVEAVAGLTAYQSAAAETGVALGAPGSPLVVVDNADDLDTFLDRADATVVLFKASTDAATLQQLARAHHRPGIVTELPGLPGHRSTAVSELSDGPLPYLATAVFPATSDVRSSTR